MGKISLPPNIGTVKDGREIGKQPYIKYIRVVCPECGEERWIELRYYKRNSYRLCAKCSSKKNGIRLTELKKTQAKYLTNKEREVLTLMGQGLPNKTIAQRIGLSKGTVDGYCVRIFKKLGVNNRVSAVVVGLYGR